MLVRWTDFLLIVLPRIDPETSGREDVETLFVLGLCKDANASRRVSDLSLMLESSMNKDVVSAPVATINNTAPGNCHRRNCQL